MSKPDSNGQPEWEQILRSLEQGQEVSDDRFYRLTIEEQALIAEIRDQQKLKETVESIEAIDLGSDWTSVKSRLDQNQVHRPVVSLFSRLARYAAVVLLPVALATGIYLSMRNKHPEEKRQTASRNEPKNITLILADGRQVELNALKSAKNIDGSLTQTDAGNGLVYQSGLSKDKAAVFNTLVVPKGASYKLLLEDLTEIWLNADSRLRYQVNFKATTTREVYLEKGEAYFKVVRNAEKPFIVHSASMRLQVLGTSFNMNAYSGKILTTLVEGKVQLESPGSGTQLFLVPGQQAGFDKNTGSLAKQEVDTFPFVAWKDGIIVFQNVTMGELMEQLGRLYDYGIEFKDPRLKQLHYTGRADKSENIKDILDIIRETANLKFTIKERSITVERQ